MGELRVGAKSPMFSASCAGAYRPVHTDELDVTAGVEMSTELEMVIMYTSTYPEIPSKCLIP